MSELLTVSDLEIAKKHDTFHSEVITGKAGGLATGLNIDTATNEVTGQTQTTLPKVLLDLGMKVKTWPASVGGTLTDLAQVFLNDIVGSAGYGNYYAWTGSFPKVVTAGLNPAITAGFIMRSDATLRNELSNAVTLIKCDGVTDVSAKITAANLVGKPILFLGVAHIAVQTTVSVPIVDTISQIFTFASLVTIDNGQPVRPEWFGMVVENIKKSVDALPATGGVVKLEAKRYPRSYSMDRANQGAGIAYLSKSNVKIIGEATPVANSDYSALIGGSSIDGPFSVFANRFHMDKVGIDAGGEVCARLWAGVTPDAFNMASTSESGGRVEKAGVGDVAVMGGGASAQMHGLLNQGHNVFYFKSITAYTCAHGVAIKSANVIGDNVVGIGNTYEALILKSDSTVPMAVAQVGKVQAYGLTSFEDGYACIIQGATELIQSIDIGQVISNSKYGSLLITGPDEVKSVHVGSVLANNNRCAVRYSGTPQSSRIDSICAVSTDSPLIVDASVVSKNNSIGAIIIDGFYDALNIYGRISIDKFSVNGVAANPIKVSTTGIPEVGHADYVGLTGAKSDLTALTLNANITGPIRIDFKDYKIALEGSGYVNAGTSTIVSVGAIPARFRPSTNLYFSVPALTGAKIVIVGTDGSIVCNTTLTTGDRVFLDTVSWAV